MAALDDPLLAIPLPDDRAFNRLCAAPGIADEGYRRGGDRALRYDGIDLAVRRDARLPSGPPGWRGLFIDVLQPSAGWCLVGLGPDLAAGYGLPHILCPFLDAAMALAVAAGADRLATLPSRLCAPISLWAEQIALFGAHGLLPVLPLIALDDDGSAQRSRGLAALVGEEILLVAPLLCREERSRRLVRLVIDRYRHGPFTDGAIFAGIGAGEAWQAERQPGLTMIRAWPGGAS